MISYLGMSEKMPNLSYYDSSGEAYGFTKPYSEETALLIDTEVRNMISEQYERAKKLLLQHADGHGKLANLLITEEVIFADDLKKVFGERQWVSRSEELYKEAEELPDNIEIEIKKKNSIKKKLKIFRKTRNLSKKKPIILSRRLKRFWV